MEEWKTIYEDSKRKILARNDERKAIDLSTGEVITEYRVTENRPRVLGPIPA
jgi:hypothetical protein